MSSSSVNYKSLCTAETQQRDIVHDIQDATIKDHELTVLQAFKLYPKAVMWSVILSAALIMDGYDLKLIGLLFAQPQFNKAYGNRQPNDTYQISAAWQSGLNNGANVGQMIGLIVSGVLTEKFGFRKTMIAALLIVPCFVFMQFFASSLIVLQIAQILFGIPLGMFQTMTCVYAVEVAPTCLRGFLTSWVSLQWVIGQVIASGVARGALSLQAPWAYRTPFAIQWFWPMPLATAIFFAPESPWWLVRQHRLDDAKAALRRLTAVGESEVELNKIVSLMATTVDHERKLNSSTTFAACFRGTDLRRTIIVMGAYIMEVASGTTLRSFATYFLLQAGLPTSQAFNMSIVTYFLSLIGTIVGWLLMPRVGRRTFYLGGLTALATIFIILGGLGIPTLTTQLSWTIASLLLVSAFVANLSVVQFSYVIASEIPSSLLRSKSVALARFSYAVVNIGASVLTPYQLNPTAWNWGAKAGFFWGGACVLGLLFTYFVIPESKDRTCAELDLLFERKISARKFVTTRVEVRDLTERIT